MDAIRMGWRLGTTKKISISGGMDGGSREALVQVSFAKPSC